MKKITISCSAFAVVAIAAMSAFLVNQDTDTQKDLLTKNIEALSEPEKTDKYDYVKYENTEWVDSDGVIHNDSKLICKGDGPLICA